MNWGPCESQSPTGKSQERDGAKGKEEELGGGQPCCHRVRALSDSLSHGIQSCKSGLTLVPHLTEPRVIQKVVDPRLIMTIVTINSSNCSL